MMSENLLKAPLVPNQIHTEAAPSIEELQPYLDRFPTEIALHILSFIFLDVNFGIYKILNVAEYKKGVLLLEAWPAIYKKFSSIFKFEDQKLSWVHQLKIIQVFIEDAQRYGNKTLRQIFYGVNLSQKKPFTIEESMRAGIISENFYLPDDVPRSMSYKKHFVKWLSEENSRIFACLRWIPAQAKIPNILKEAAKHNDFHVFKRVFKYTAIHKLYGKKPPYKYALWHIVENNQVESVKYLLYKNPRMGLSTDLLHVAARHGYLEIVKLFVEKGVDVDALNYYEETTVQATIQKLFGFYLFSSSREDDQEKYQQALDRIHVIIFLMQKAKIFNIEWEPYATTLLHLPCYIPFSEESKWFVQYLLEKNPKSIHMRDLEGNTPLLCAGKEKNREMVELLIRNGAITSKLHWMSTLISFLFQGSGMWKIIWQTRGKKALSQASLPLSRAPAILSVSLNSNNTDTSRDIPPWKQMTYRIYAHARAVVLFIPRAFYTLYHHTLGAL